MKQYSKLGIQDEMSVVSSLFTFKCSTCFEPHVEQTLNKVRKLKLKSNLLIRVFESKKPRTNQNFKLNVLLEQEPGYSIVLKSKTHGISRFSSLWIPSTTTADLHCDAVGCRTRTRIVSFEGCSWFPVLPGINEPENLLLQ